MKLLLLIVFISTGSAKADDKIAVAVIDMELAIINTSDGKIAQAHLAKEYKFLEKTNRTVKTYC